MNLRRVKIKTLISRKIDNPGDALCLIPGILTYLRGHSNEDVTIAFPKNCLPVFKNIFKAVENVGVDPLKYDKFINLDDPDPSVAYELRKEKTDLNRLKIFSRFFKVEPTSIRRPILSLDSEEMKRGIIIKRFKRGNMVGIDDSIYNYKEIVDILCNNDEINHVVVVGDEKIDNPKVINLLKEDVRTIFIHQALCNLYITTESLFLHSAAALGIPTILLEGPRRNGLFQEYPIVKAISSNHYKCIPCWKGSSIPCIHAPFEPTVEACMEKIDLNILTKEINAYFSKVHRRQ